MVLTAAMGRITVDGMTNKPPVKGSEPPVEKGLPIPARNAMHRKWPFAKMESGDSFFVACGDDVGNQTVRAMFSSASTWLRNNRPEWKASVRRVEGGVRVWLLAPEDQ